MAKKIVLAGTLLVCMVFFSACGNSGPRYVTGWNAATNEVTHRVEEPAERSPDVSGALETGAECAQLLAEYALYNAWRVANAF